MSQTFFEFDRWRISIKQSRAKLENLQQQERRWLGETGWSVRRMTVLRERKLLVNKNWTAWTVGHLKVRSRREREREREQDLTSRKDAEQKILQMTSSASSKFWPLKRLEGLPIRYRVCLVQSGAWKLCRLLNLGFLIGKFRESEHGLSMAWTWPEPGLNRTFNRESSSQSQCGRRMLNLML